MDVKIVKLRKVFSFLIGVLILTGSNGFAQDTRVEAELSSKKVVLGSSLQFTITIHGENNIDPIELPAIEGFEVTYLGPSTRVSVVNGQYSSSKSFVYSLFPLKVGTFTIPAFAVNISGTEYRLQPFSIEVVESPRDVTSLSDDQPMNLQDKLFVVLKIPKREVYLNEPLPVKILLFVSGLSVRDVQHPPDLNNIGFSIDEYDKPQQYQQVANGLRYDIIEFNTRIYPTRVGELPLGPARVECNLLVQSSTRGSRFGSRQSIFDDDFFNSFFDRHEKRAVVLESDEVTINVLPLPAEGRPKSFSGAVGQFGFNVTANPNQVNEGDPITLRMTINGKGNLSSIQMPPLSFQSDFKLYDPQIIEKDGIKKSEQVIIPQSEEITEIPAIVFSYFDPQLKKYRTITRGPFPIQVTKLGDTEEFKVVGLEGEFRPISPEKFGEDIVFIKKKPGTFRVSGQHVYATPLFYIMLFLIVSAWTAVFLNFKRTHRMKTDSVYARRLLAPQKAKKGLAQAKSFIADGKREEFYDVIFKTLQQYLGNKLHLPSGAVTFESVCKELQSRNIEQKIIDDIGVIFEECDMIRYALGAINQEDKSVSYQRLARNIDYLERHLK